EIADRAIEGEDAAALDQDGAAGRGLLRLRGAGDRCDRRRCGNRRRRRGAEEVAPRQRGLRIASSTEAAGRAEKTRHGILPILCCCAGDATPDQCSLLAKSTPGAMPGVGCCPT